jgi:hypothetical protein
MADTTVARMRVLAATCATVIPAAARSRATVCPTVSAASLTERNPSFAVR